MKLPLKWVQGGGTKIMSQHCTAEVGKNLKNCMLKEKNRKIYTWAWAAVIFAHPRLHGALVNSAEQGCDQHFFHLLSSDFTPSLGLAGLVHGRINSLTELMVMLSFLIKLVWNESSSKCIHPWINPPPSSFPKFLAALQLLPSVTSKTLNINLCYDIYF